MSRSVWKGPFVDPSLIKKVEKLKDQSNRPPIKTWSRKSTIIPEFVGFSFLIPVSYTHLTLPTTPYV